MRASSVAATIFQNILAAVLLTAAITATARDRWTPEQANAWYAKQPWLVGCNYTPRTAINQLKMWQADTWDPKTIDQELGWAHKLGFTSARVFLHDCFGRMIATG